MQSNKGRDEEEGAVSGAKSRAPETILKEPRHGQGEHSLAAGSSSHSRVQNLLVQLLR